MSCPCRPLFSKVLRKERLAQVCAIFILKRTDLKLFVIFNNRKLYFAKLRKNAGIINRNRNNSASSTDNKRITLKISEIREIAI